MYKGITARLSVITTETVENKTTEEEKDVAYISNFSIEETKDIVEITKLGSAEKEKVATLYSWSASADGVADFDTAEIDKTGTKNAITNQTLLRTAMKDGTPLKIKFFLSDDYCLIGEALVESLSLDISAEDKANVSISLSGVGSLLSTSEKST